MNGVQAADQPAGGPQSGRCAGDWRERVGEDSASAAGRVHAGGRAGPGALHGGEGLGLARHFLPRPPRNRLRGPAAQQHPIRQEQQPRDLHTVISPILFDKMFKLCIIYENKAKGHFCKFLYG